MAAKSLGLIAEHKVKWVDLRFTDLNGGEHHLTLPATRVDEDFLEEGQMFDGSAMAGWKGVDESDMILLPDDSSAVLDPFTHETTLIINCEVIDPITLQSYSHCPRGVAARAEDYLRATGLADTAFFGPEPEFFIFDAVTWETSMQAASYCITSSQGAWASNSNLEGGNKGHRPRVKGGYLPLAPVDAAHEIRTAMSNALIAMGMEVEIHHQEVATANQAEIGVAFNTLVKKADEVQRLKYCVKNVAAAYNKTATFMPKPLVGDNGSGMHVHQSLVKNDTNIFAGEGYGGLSETALFYIGGIIKHAKALNALTNPLTNSYKRLVAGFDAPVMLAYSAKNRSASIRIPYTTSAKARRVETRFPDPGANPYLCFAALLMAGLDGIQNKIHPGDAMDKNLYDLPAEIKAGIPQVATSLEEALAALDEDREFLTKGGVFSNGLIDSFIKLKQQEVVRLNTTTHPVEFDMYYSI